MIKAEIVADSVSPDDNRLVTFKVRYPWFIHGEVMTHRMLSRNASSNRAIPLAKMLQEVRDDALRAEPVYWGAEQKGMEPGGELTGEALHLAKLYWAQAADYAATCAEQMAVRGLHKSLCNRLLMPFTHANVIISATEWDNFFGLRLDKAADPTMRALAEAMWAVMNESTPRLLRPGEWHLPFVDEQTYKEAGPALVTDVADATWLKVSVARCARVSYESFETGKRSTVEEDLKLYDRLVGAQPLHASPAEHQATPDEEWDWGICASCNEPVSKWQHYAEHGNFVGWRQYRKMLAGEAVAPLPVEYVK